MLNYKGKDYNNPVLVCEKCNAKVFKLPNDVQGNENVHETIMRSSPIPPQPKASPTGRAKCATCGIGWDIDITVGLVGLRVEEE